MTKKRQKEDWETSRRRLIYWNSYAFTNNWYYKKLKNHSNFMIFDKCFVWTLSGNYLLCNNDLITYEKNLLTYLYFYILRIIFFIMESLLPLMGPEMKLKRRKSN